MQNYDFFFITKKKREKKHQLSTAESLNLRKQLSNNVGTIIVAVAIVLDGLAHSRFALSHKKGQHQVSLSVG